MTLDEIRTELKKLLIALSGGPDECDLFYAGHILGLLNANLSSAIFEHEMAVRLDYMTEERDRYAWTALAGLRKLGIATTEDGYVKDGGVEQLERDFQSFKGRLDAIYEMCNRLKADRSKLIDELKKTSAGGGET